VVDGDHRVLWLEGDGNLVLYKRGRAEALWALLRRHGRTPLDLVVPVAR
jgi:hypothetical protein